MTVAATVSGIRFAPVDFDSLTLDEATIIQDFGQTSPGELLTACRAGNPTARQAGALLLVAARRIDGQVGPDDLARLSYVEAYTAAADVLLAATRQPEGKQPAGDVAAKAEVAATRARAQIPDQVARWLDENPDALDQALERLSR